MLSCEDEKAFLKQFKENIHLGRLIKTASKDSTQLGGEAFCKPSFLKTKAI